MKRLTMMCVTAALLVGCGGKEEAAAPASPEPTKAVTGKGFSELDNAVVLATVGDRKLTKLDVETDLALQVALLRILQPGIRADRIQRERNRLLRTAISKFVSRQVLALEAERRGVTATPAEIEVVHTNFMAQAFRGRKLTYAAMRAQLTPPMARKIDADLAADAVVFKVSEALRKETEYVPTDAEVAEKLAKFKDYNANAQKIESEIGKLATNAWQRLQSGEPFGRTAEWAKTKNEHVTFEEDWGAFELEYFNDCPVLKSCLTVMKPGMVSLPVPADNGLVIVRLDELLLPKQPMERTRYRLSQIHFALPEYYKDYTAATLKAELAKEKSKRQMKAKIDELTQAAKVTYPCGTEKQLFDNDRKNSKKEGNK